MENPRPTPGEPRNAQVLRADARARPGGAGGVSRSGRFAPSRALRPLAPLRDDARRVADVRRHLQIVLEGTVAIGDLLVVGTSGGALKATTGQKVVGIAKIAGASGDVGEIFFRPWLGTAP